MELAFSSFAPFGPHYSPPTPRLPGPLLLSLPPPILLSQALPELSERYRPLLLAAVKGYLTRRLLRSERVAQLVRTVRVSRDRFFFFWYFLEGGVIRTVSRFSCASFFQFLYVRFGLLSKQIRCLVSYYI